MDRFGKLQLKESQKILDDSEMKMIIGGYINYGGHVIDSPSCIAPFGTCQGACPDYEYKVIGSGGQAIYASMPRYCVSLSHPTGPALGCICATKDATAPWG